MAIHFVGAANAPAAGSGFSATATQLNSVGGTAVFGPYVYQPAGGQVTVLAVDAFNNGAGVGFAVNTWAGSGSWIPAASQYSMGTTVGVASADLNLMQKAVTNAPVAHQARSQLSKIVPTARAPLGVACPSSRSLSLSLH